jgi:hypothetical protein
MKEQLYALGCLYDWSKELASCDPSTTAGTSGSSCACGSRGSRTARRRPSTGARLPTVLANEQVVDGRCERCGDPVEIRDLTQWFFASPTTPTACSRARPPAALVRARQDDAAQLDRPLRGRRDLFRVDGLDRAADGLHDAARHALRRDVPGARARAPACALAAFAAPSARSRRSSSASAASRASSARPRRRKEGLDTGRSRSTRRRASRSRLARQLRASGVRHGRDHGRAGARPARLRVRPQVRLPSAWSTRRKARVDAAR